MIGPLFKLAMEAAKKVPVAWWKKAAVTVGTAIVTALGIAFGTEAIGKIMRDKKKTPEQKISELRKLKDSGEITEEHFEELKKTVLDAYAKL